MKPLWAEELSTAIVEGRPNCPSCGVRVGSSGQGVAADVRPAGAEGDRIAVEVEPSDFRPFREAARAEHIDELGRFDVRQVGVSAPQFGADGEGVIERVGRDAEADPHISAKPSASSAVVVPNRVLGRLTRLSSAVSHCTAPVSVVARRCCFFFRTHFPCRLTKPRLHFTGGDGCGGGTAAATVWNVWSGPAVVPNPLLATTRKW